AVNAIGSAAAVSGAPPTFQTFSSRLSALAQTGTLDPLGSAAAPPSPELFIRWQQIASLLPSFEVPPADDPTSPWNFSEPYRSAARAALARRQSFLPYLQPLFDRFATTGASPLRSLPSTGQPTFLLGDWVLVAPVVEDGASTREVELPAEATWI